MRKLILVTAIAMLLVPSTVWAQAMQGRQESRGQV
jgi:hypothetical protein